MKEAANSTRVNGLFLVIDRRQEKGLKRWCNELERRGIPGIISMHEQTVLQSCGLARDISDRGFEIACGYKEAPFWNESYDFQRNQIIRLKELVESCIGKQLRIVSSKYFAYTEETLRVADELGIPYVLGRGASGTRAVVYQPREYRVKIVSISNVPSKAMGTGSLCDESLRCRMETPETLREMLLHLDVDCVVLVAQTHVSGMKIHWWDAYQDLLDAGIVAWKSLEEFASQSLVLPNAEIPVNAEADYAVPRPLIPLEQEEGFHDSWA